MDLSPWSQGARDEEWMRTSYIEKYKRHVIHSKTNLDCCIFLSKRYISPLPAVPKYIVILLFYRHRCSSNCCAVPLILLRVADRTRVDLTSPLLVLVPPIDARKCSRYGTDGLVWWSYLIWCTVVSSWQIVERQKSSASIIDHNDATQCTTQTTTVAYPPKPWTPLPSLLARIQKDFWRSSFDVIISDRLKRVSKFIFNILLTHHLHLNSKQRLLL